MAMRKQTREVAVLTALALCVLASAVWIQGGQVQNTPAGRGCNLPEPFPCPVARILELTVGPATINPGESARITWRAENPTNMTLVARRRPCRIARNHTGVTLRDDDVYPADRGRAERGGCHPHGNACRARDSTRRRCRHNGAASDTSDA